jgi:ATPase subunit of ABC transporter with duplicated ATPase domains
MALVAAMLLVFSGILLVHSAWAFTNHRPLWKHFHGGRDFYAAAPGLAEPPALQVEDLTCTHDGGDNYQLYEVSYNLPRGAKVALLGRNGAGKSTFLRILAEATCLDARLSTADLGMKFTGQITCPRNVRVAFVEQEPPMLADVTVADALLGMSGDMSGEVKNDKSVYATVRRYRHASENVDLDREFRSLCR